jgi:fumarate hydratase, class I
MQFGERHTDFNAAREHSLSPSEQDLELTREEWLEAWGRVHVGQIAGRTRRQRDGFIAKTAHRLRGAGPLVTPETRPRATSGVAFRRKWYTPRAMAQDLDFGFTPILPLAHDSTPFRKLTGDYVTTFEAKGKSFIEVAPEGLTLLAATAMVDIAHYLRPGHLAQLRAILDDTEASQNDRFVALDLLKNAVISAKGVLPMCQDTGTAIVMGKKGQFVLTAGDDERAIARGIYNTYHERNLRYSQLAPLSMYEEVNTKTNLPAQIELFATDGAEYKFLFMAKGGGSANKSYLYQETKALLNPKRLLSFLEEKMKSLGTAACPPYHLAIVVGGTSAEYALKTAKLASARYLDTLPTEGSKLGHGFRDLKLEAEVLEISRRVGIGAQFGGKYFCHDVRVIRLPRHGASCPVAIAVSCSADRQALGKITSEGVFLEELERDPGHFLPDPTDTQLGGEVVTVDLNRPMSEIREQLSKYPVKTRLALNGKLVVARDIAHAKIKANLDQGQPMPDYLKNHPVYYAGPAKTPTGMASGSFGPTTAGRMDSYVDEFQARGGSLVMLAKGNRGKEVTEACKKHGGFYLGSIGGPAARLAEDCIKKVEVLEFQELGMEAVWMIEVVDFPAFIVVDDKGNDFFETLDPGHLPMAE